ncbi:MAG: hypothetical protein MZV49_12640 [Rhodopseudomonas palustris]|nr:hypothetical protein [Rhodopseudomonas palustris]
MMTMGVARGITLDRQWGIRGDADAGDAAGDRPPRADPDVAAHACSPISTSWPDGSPAVPGRGPGRQRRRGGRPASRSPWSRLRASTRRPRAAARQRRPNERREAAPCRRACVP